MTYHEVSTEALTGRYCYDRSAIPFVSQRNGPCTHTYVLSFPSSPRIHSDRYFYHHFHCNSLPPLSMSSSPTAGPSGTVALSHATQVDGHTTPQPATPDKSPLVLDSTDEEDNGGLGGRKKKKKKKKKKSDDKLSKMHNDNEKPDRFPWKDYHDAEESLWNRVDEYLVASADGKATIKKELTAGIITEYGPFKHYVDEDITMVSV